MLEVTTSHITSHDALYQNTLVRITSSSVIRGVTLTVHRNYNVAVCQVLAVLPYNSNEGE